MWAMAFWVELLVSRYSRVSTFSYNHIGEQSVPKQENEVVLDKDDYEIKSKVDLLTEEIENSTNSKKAEQSRKKNIKTQRRLAQQILFISEFNSKINVIY